MSIAALGECMLELQGPAFGNLRQTFGGDTLNTAVYLARCGGADLRVHYATALGAGSLSTGLLERWQAEGVLTGLVQRLPGRVPGLYLIELEPSGERHFHYWRGQAAARAYFDAATTALEEQADALDALPAAQRAVMVLTYYHDMAYADIAEIVECPLNTVKTRMFHARHRLKDLLWNERENSQ